MGRFARVIDSVALGLIVYAAAFYYFFRMLGSALAAAVIAVAPAALLGWAYRRWSAKRYASRDRARRARALTERLVFLPEAEARAEATRYAALTGELLLRHPKGAPMDVNEVLTLWRNTASDETCTIATTGRFSDEARAVAEGLTAPKVKLIDGREIAGLIARSGLPLDAPPRVKRRFTLRIPKKRAKHCAIYGCAMLGVYLFTGLWTYLVAALILLALTILSFRRPMAAPG
jgi:hypothetical protein